MIYTTEEYLRMRQRAQRAEKALADMTPDKGWRAFNRLSAAVSRHHARSQPEHPAYRFPDDLDDDLHRAYVKILHDIGPVLRETEDVVLRGGSP